MGATISASIRCAQRGPPSGRVVVGSCRKAPRVRSPTPFAGAQRLAAEAVIDIGMGQPGQDGGEAGHGAIGQGLAEVDQLGDRGEGGQLLLGQGQLAPVLVVEAAGLAIDQVLRQVPAGAIRRRAPS